MSMEVVIAIATMEGREEFLANTIRSLAPQCDQLRIYKNHHRDIDYTDNAKFFFLQEYDRSVYYLTCDDDIIYPADYVQKMIQGIETHGGIVTLHGRILRYKGLSYYRGRHKTFHCAKWVNRTQRIHVGGSGVMGWRTDQFNPVDLYKHEHQKMSDLIVSLEAAKKGVPITVLEHPKNYVTVQPVPNEKTIFGQHVMNDTIQSSLADEVLRILPKLPN